MQARHPAAPTFLHPSYPQQLCAPAQAAQAPPAAPQAALVSPLTQLPALQQPPLHCWVPTTQELVHRKKFGSHDCGAPLRGGQ